MKSSSQAKRHRTSLPLSKRNSGIMPKLEVYNSTSLTNMGSEESQELGLSKLEMTNYQLFKFAAKGRESQCQSALPLFRNLPHVASKNVTRHHLSQANFPVLMYKIKELVEFGAILLQTSNFASINFCENSLKKLVRAIALSYNEVSYHNFSHAFMLTLLNYQCFCKQQDMRALYTQEEYFYILIAGLSHDLNHRGTNNSFQVKCKTSLAEQFKNESVLENMHIRTLWKILEDNPQENFLYRTNDRSKAKHIITRLILSTDMAFHFKNLSILKQCNHEIQNNEVSKEAKKWFLMEQLFHACDIGNPTLEFDNYISWAALLSYEFNQQTVLQQKMNVEVTVPFIYHDLSTLYKDQVWFLGNVVHPLWKQLSVSWPNLEEFVKGIDSNLRRINTEMQSLRQ